MRTRLIHPWFTLAVLILAHCSLIATAPAQVPLLIHYQGRLVDNGALVNGDVVMSYRPTSRHDRTASDSRPQSGRGSTVHVT